MASIDTLKSALAGVGGDISVSWPGNLIMVPAPAMYTALGGVMPPKLLSVPYYSQEAADARQFGNECGVVCVRMLFDWQADKLNLPRLNLTTDQLARETPLALSDTGLGNLALVTLAAKHNFTLKVSGGVNQAFIQEQIGAGLPLICLISYAPILGRENQRDTSGHFVVAVGYDAQNIYVNDPDWWNQGNYTADMGHNLRIPWSQFNAALAAYGNTGCVVARLFVPTKLYVVLTNMNIRSGSSVYNGTVGSGAKLGSTVIIDLSQQLPDTAGNVFVPLWGGNWIALKNTPQNHVYLDVVMPAPPTDPFKTKWGLHVIWGGDYNAIEGMARDGLLPGITNMKVAGRGDALSNQKIKVASNGRTKILNRWYSEDDPLIYPDWNKDDLTAEGAALCQQYYDLYLASDPDSLLADWHQLFNEPTSIGHGPGMASFWLGAMKKAEQLGIKLAIGCFSERFPPLPTEAPEFWIPFFDVLRYAKTHGHVYMIHGYLAPDPGGSWTNSPSMLRHRLELTPADLQDMPTIYAEYGTAYGAGIDDDSYIAGVDASDAELMKDAAVLFVSGWTAGGGGGWPRSNINGKLPRIIQRAKAL